MTDKERADIRMWAVDRVLQADRDMVLLSWSSVVSLADKLRFYAETGIAPCEEDEQ